MILNIDQGRVQIPQRKKKTRKNTDLYMQPCVLFAHSKYRNSLQVNTHTHIHRASECAPTERWVRHGYGIKQAFFPLSSVCVQQTRDSPSGKYLPQSAAISYAAEKQPCGWASLCR